MDSGLDSPYPGLRPFQDHESPIFFGRGQQIADMLTELETHRFLAVVGSGSGKSSLVRAGLLPALRDGFLSGTGENWLFVVMSPGATPFTNIASAFYKAVHETNPDPQQLAFEEAQMRRGREAFVEAVENARLPEGTSVLLLVDQFEEIFRFRRNSAVREADSAFEEKSLSAEDKAKLQEREERTYLERNDATAFVNLMLKTSEQAVLPIYVVLTMRSDFVGYCDSFHGMPEAMNKAQFLTPRMRRDQAREAIVGPLGLFGATASPELINEVLNEIGSDPDQLPLMQHLLARMWTLASSERGSRKGGSGKLGVIPRFQRRGKQRTQAAEAGLLTLTLDDYRTLGGLKGALSAHANLAFSELGDQDQGEKKRIAEILFRSLCDRGYEGQLTRRNPPPSIGMIAAVAGVSWEEVASVAKPFLQEGRSFIYANPRGELTPATKLDISHEALIRQWTRMREWAKVEADSAETYLEVLKAARRWKNREDNLWKSHALKRGLRWLKLQQPTRAWAERYDRDLPLAKRFLHKSRSRREMKLSFALACILSVLVLGGFFAKTKYDEYVWQQERAARQAQADAEAEARRERLRVAEGKLDIAEGKIRTGSILEGIMNYWAAADLFPPDDPKHHSARSLIAAWSEEAGYPLIHNGPLLGLGFSEDGGILVTLSENQENSGDQREVCFWRVGSATSASLVGEPIMIPIANFAPDLNASTRSWVITPEGAFQYVIRQPSRAPPGRYTVERVSLVNDALSTDRQDVEGDFETPPNFGWSPDGRVLAALSGDRLTVWEILFDSRKQNSLVDVAEIKPAVVRNPNPPRVPREEKGKGRAGIENELGGEGQVRREIPLDPVIRFSPNSQLLVVANVGPAKSPAAAFPPRAPRPGFRLAEDAARQPAIPDSELRLYALGEDRASSPATHAVWGPVRMARLEFSPDSAELAVIWNIVDFQAKRVSTAPPAPSPRLDSSPPPPPLAPPPIYVGPDEPIGTGATIGRRIDDPWGFGYPPIAHLVERFRLEKSSLIPVGAAGEAALPTRMLLAGSGDPSAKEGSRKEHSLFLFYLDGSITLWGGESRRRRNFLGYLSPEDSEERTVTSPLQLDPDDRRERPVFGTWQLPTGHKKEITAYALDSDGVTLITGSRDWSVRFLNTERESFGRNLIHGDEIVAIAQASNREIIATASKDRTVRLWPSSQNASIEKIPLELPGVEIDMTEIAFPSFGPDNRSLLLPAILEPETDSEASPFPGTASRSGLLLHLPVKPGGKSRLEPLIANEASLADSRHNSEWTVFSSSAGSRKHPQGIFFTGSDEGSIHLWDAANGLEITPKKMEMPQQGVVFGSLRSDGTLLLTSGGGPTISCWEVESGELRFVLDVTSGEVSKTVPTVDDSDEIFTWVKFHPTERDQFLTAGPDDFVRLWNLEGRSCTVILRLRHGHASEQVEDWLMFADIAPTQDQIVSSGIGGDVKLWRRSDGQLLNGGLRFYEEFGFAVYNADGSRLLTAGGGDSDGEMTMTAQLWDVVTGHPIGSELNLPGTIPVLRPDGGAIAWLEDPDGSDFLAPPPPPPPAPLLHEDEADLPVPPPAEEKEPVPPPKDLPPRLVLSHIPPPDLEESSEHLKLRLEVLTGMTYNESKGVIPISQAAWLERRAKLAALDAAGK